MANVTSKKKVSASNNKTSNTSRQVKVSRATTSTSKPAQQTKRKVGRTLPPKKNDKPKFKPRTFERITRGNEFGKNLYDYVTRIFTIKDGVSDLITNQFHTTLDVALKEVKLIDKAIKRIKFKSLKQDQMIPSLKSFNDLHLRKKAILSLIAKANCENTISINIGSSGNKVTMTMFAARMHLKEMKEYVKRFKESRLKIGNDDVESIVKEIESTIIDIESELHKAASRVAIIIPR